MGNNNRQDLYTRRSSVRLPGFDYASTGAYFVTVCTEHRKPIFEMPEISKLLVEVWETLPDRFSSVMLDEFIVMPDHIYGLLWLDDTVKNAPTLSKVMDAYKSLTTVAWLNYNKARGTWCSKHLWQRGYYDHVIRNDQDLELTREYIRNNPLRLKEIWRNDP